MGDTSIEWTRGDDGSEGKTWNPTDGCEVCSPGCANCYAMRFAGRFSKPGQRYHGLVTIAKNKRAVWSGEARLDAHKLAAPLTWKKPTRVFVNSMSDLFYERFTNEEIAAVFGVMAACPQHTFMVLTKRARRMREWFEWVRSPSEDSFTMRQRGIVAAPNTGRALLDAAYEYLGKARKPELDAAWHSARVEADAWPLPNVWLGVSVENQDAADERIPELTRTPAVVHFLSCEPLLGSVNLGRIDGHCGSCGASDPCGCSLAYFNPKWLNWVIAGCESGPGARPCDVAWLRSLRDQCARAGVPYFLKQAVAGVETTRAVYPSKQAARVVVHAVISEGDGSHRKPGGVIGAPYLDGVQHLAFPVTR